jgi:hypothetical protein
VGKRAGDAADELRDVGAGGIVHGRVGDDVGDGEAARGLSNARFRERLRLVGREVDDAAGQDDVDRVGGYGRGSAVEVGGVFASGSGRRKPRRG